MPSGHRASTELQPSRRTTITARSGGNILPQYVQQTLSQCAQPCLSAVITRDWACQDNDFSCLCSHYSSDGFTLGEEAYVCLQLNCPGFAQHQANDAYHVCAAQPNQVAPRHSVLTIPAASPTATASSSQHTTISTQPTASTSTHRAVTTTAVSSAPGSVISTASSTDTASPSTAGSASATSTTDANASLSSAQTIGISVAALCAVVVLVAAIWLVAWMKRRKRNRLAGNDRHSYDFIDDAPSRFSSLKGEDTTHQGEFGESAFGHTEKSFEKRRTEWPTDLHVGNQYHYPQYPQYQAYEKSAKRSSYTGPSSPASRRSDGSTRTTSQLLPDKPLPIPSKSPKQKSVTVHSPTTVFEEEHSPTLPAVTLPGLSMSTMSTQKPRQPQPTHQPLRPAHAVRQNAFQPSLALAIPKQAQRSAPTQHSGPYSRPPPPILRPALRPPQVENRLSERSQAQTSTTSLLDYYTNAETNSPDLYSSTPIEEKMQIRRPPPAAITVTKPAYPPLAIRASTMSNHSNRTSFESTDPDEPTPPDEDDKRLTPVAESPIISIKYPKIPRSSNQAVPRSPPSRTGINTAGHAALARSTQSPQHNMNKPYTPDQRPPTRGHTPSLSGSTLATRRRGDNLATNLERGLYIHESNHSRSNSQKSSTSSQAHPYPHQLKYASPLKGHGRVASPNRKEIDWPLRLNLSPQEMRSPDVKSPLWAPKLTPRREGDDLYLDLSLATPQSGRFPTRHW